MKNKHVFLWLIVFSFFFCSSTFYAEEVMVIPSGKSIGVTLNTDGVMVVGVSDVYGSDGKKYLPAKDGGIKPADIIKSIDKNKITNLEELNAAITNSNGKKICVEVERNGKIINVNVTPKISNVNNNYKIGIWVKDAASGIGTLTFWNPSDNTFAALGHGITDTETGSIISSKNGSILKSTILEIDKSENGKPGELKGTFNSDSDVIGMIKENTPCGLFGTIKGEVDNTNKKMSIAEIENIKKGEAYILANIEGTKVEKYNIEIQKIMLNQTDTKNMVIKITDKRLLNKTGGIVQGMSGSPIIQNEKLVGAVTHVFVNDPTRGYGIFAEKMYENAKK